MHLIEPKIELIKQGESINDLYKHIEKIGRCCWASENYIKEGSAKIFVDNLINNNHGAPLEHGTVYLYLTRTSPVADPDYLETTRIVQNYKQNPYSKVVELTNNHFNYNYYITTNLRVLLENNWLEDLQYWCIPTEHHVRRLTFHFTCQRAISAEFNRHRKDSIMESSSRYCNYSLGKFGNAISVCPSQWVKDAWLDTLSNEVHESIAEDLEYSNKGLETYCYEVANEQTENLSLVDYWWFANLACEYAYLGMINLGAKPQEARDVLPMDLKTELYHTAYLSDWLHFCDLRAWKSKGNSPHPEAINLASQVFDTLVAEKLIQEDYRTSRMVK